MGNSLIGWMNVLGGRPFHFLRVPREQRRWGVPSTMTLESSNSTVRCRRVAFSDPDETLLLPSSMESMTVWRNAGVTRQFITHEISNYRRFVTGARVVGAQRQR